MLSSLKYTLSAQNGILLSKQCIVNRITFTGRNILGYNDTIDPNATNRVDRDFRGYVPVESWILSHTETVNAIPVKNEGISQLRLLNDCKNQETLIYFNQLLSNIDCKDMILGNNFKLSQWPLIKILDIGGTKVMHNNEYELPPIPCHVHYGTIDSLSGEHVLPPKDEAYFFPQLPDFAKNINDDEEDDIVYSRLGIKNDIDQETFLNAMKRWGVDSSLYDTLNPYKLEINTGWTIFGGIVHAPGPILTLEIQRAQDDYNLLSWHLGKTIQDKDELNMLKKQHFFKDSEFVINHKHGSEEFILDTLINWDLSKDVNFENNYKRNRLLLNKADFGEHYQIFFDIFYGESLHVKYGKSYKIENNKKQPFCGLTWNGKGLINGNKINSLDDNCREFLIANEYSNCVEFVNNNEQQQDLVIYLLYPLQI